jgi:hypothetical protein
MEMAERSPSPGEVWANLSEVSRLRDLRRRPPAVDFDAGAVARRLRRVSELRDLCLWLAPRQPTVAGPQVAEGLDPYGVVSTAAAAALGSQAREHAHTTEPDASARAVAETKAHRRRR